VRIEDVPVEKISFGDRYRKDFGDVESLAANIREMGLLQPIGVDAYYQLIFGARRLEACADILGWKQIPCIVLALESVLAGEYAENEFRKQFTASERAAIGKAVEAELLANERRGGDHKSKSAIAHIDSPNNRSVDLAAKRAGFESAESFERAKTVVQKGSPELITAMDKGEVSIAAAAAIARQPKEDQAQILAMPKEERREVVRQIRKTKADKEADEQNARDLRLFGGLNEAVHFIAGFHEGPHETWDGLSRVFAYQFVDDLERAIQCLIRLQKEHPNAKRYPAIVARKAP
jgi:ParB family chromosome partitioning protein